MIDPDRVGREKRRSRRSTPSGTTSAKLASIDVSNKPVATQEDDPWFVILVPAVPGSNGFHHGTRYGPYPKLPEVKIFNENTTMPIGYVSLGEENPLMIVNLSEVLSITIAQQQHFDAVERSVPDRPDSPQAA